MPDSTGLIGKAAMPAPTDQIIALKVSKNGNKTTVTTLNTGDKITYNGDSHTIKDVVIDIKADNDITNAKDVNITDAGLISGGKKTHRKQGGRKTHRKRGGKKASRRQRK